MQTQDIMGLSSSRTCIKCHVMIAIRVNNIGNAYIKMHATGHSTRAVKGNYTKLYLNNGLSPGRSQAIIWTDAEILLIGPLGSNCTEIVIEIITLSFKKMRFKVSSVKRRPFCIGLNVLNNCDDFFYRCNTWGSVCIITSVHHLSL